MNLDTSIQPNKRRRRKANVSGKKREQKRDDPSALGSTEVPALINKGGERSIRIEGVREQSRDAATDRYVKRMLHAAAERYGMLEETEPRHQLLHEIQDRLTALMDIPAGKTVAIEDPSINAFVIEGTKDVYIYAGLLRAFGRWCERNNRPLTKDGIATIIAHELTHIDQKTQEVNGTNQGSYAIHGSSHRSSQP